MIKNIFQKKTSIGNPGPRHCLVSIKTTLFTDHFLNEKFSYEKTGNWVVCPKFGHPVQNSDIYLSS